MINDRFLLLGLGIANNSLKEYFDKENINYIIYDDNIKEYKKDVDYNQFDYIIKSPGIKDNHLIIQNAKTLGKVIISDLEFFYKYGLKKHIICVTGTNSKTTTVTFIHLLLNELDLGGNVGDALGNYLDSKNDIVIEASSFMLDYIIDFQCEINLITNIFLNHIDHHESLKNYIRAKLKLIKNIKRDDYLIYNYDGLILKRLFQYLEVKKIEYSLKEKKDLYLENNNVIFNNKSILNLDEISLKGTHNKYNILAAISCIIAYDENKIIELEKLKSFKALNHRIEYIGKLNGISVYNDSKSTNFNALRCSLNTFKNNNVLLVVGGKLKEDNFEIINDELKQVKFVLINGENRYELLKFFKEHNKDILVMDNLIGILSLIDKYIEGIDTILFSPGSSSYDQFNNYEDRGNFFKNKMYELYELKLD